ncbi:MAG TPA: ANTAR domain-containing protein [Pseudonocardiaceae bacterium]|jgi:AmiR/NasT family two-component response regulator|nr:ANTAR domain-containing protein [Pseudonocardiaceae bacterium]
MTWWPSTPITQVKSTGRLLESHTISLLQIRTLRHSEMVTEQLQIALNSRLVIEQAKGILAERRHISLTQAFALMRAYARNHNQLLSHVARAIINQAHHIAELTNVADPPR